MKKDNIKILALTMTLCVSTALSACAANATDTQQSNNVTSNSLISAEQAYDSSDTSSSNFTAEVYENDEVISSEEQAKAEENRRNEIAEQYSAYEPYGMTYDKEKDRFFYDGQTVRYFKDQVNAEHANSFFFDDGVVDMEPIKDTNGTLTGLKQSSDADFKARTEKQEEIKAEFDAAGITGNSGSFEMGDPNYRDDSLDAYTAFGVSYDKTSDNWMYEGKVIHIFYDAGHNTYCDNGASNGINLKVIRDKNGNIEKLVETEAQELEQYVKSTNLCRTMAKEKKPS